MLTVVKAFSSKGEQTSLFNMLIKDAEQREKEITATYNRTRSDAVGL